MEKLCHPAETVERAEEVRISAYAEPKSCLTIARPRYQASLLAQAIPMDEAVRKVCTSTLLEPLGCDGLCSGAVVEAPSPGESPLPPPPAVVVAVVVVVATLSALL